MKQNKKGFTLIELLAVIVILGLLMAIAIPSVTKYITQSRKKTLISSIDSYVTAVTTAVNDNEFGALSNESVCYYVPVSNVEDKSCVALEKGGTDPFGNWLKAYVIVHYNADLYSYDYFFTFVDDGGYGMVASAKVGGRRLIGVINGFHGKGHEALAGEMKKLLEFGFANTVGKVFFRPGDVVTKIPVWYGRQATVDATVTKPFAVTTSKENGIKNIRILARFNEPVAAPVRAGDEIGQLIAEQNGRIVANAPLVAKDKVSKTQFFGRVIKNIKVIFGWE